jgi:hypothetical protein
MHNPRDTLLNECDNIQRVLDETLRSNYGLEGSEDFYTECQARLAYIKSELTATADADHATLQKNSALLSALSDLLSRIERSSIEHYSWPFVDELKKLALALCEENTLVGPNTPPYVFVLSEGGPDAYAIRPEQQRPSGASRRIHTITLPRTLKHFVLLHSILGHEIGHAMYRSSKHQNDLANIINTQLLPGSPLANPTDAASWIYAPTAPVPVRQQLAALGTQYGFTQANLWTKYDYGRWLEEILCDFIGIMTFGPSFVAAEAEILFEILPSGADLGPYHPPPACRLTYLMKASLLLGHRPRAFADAGLNTLSGAFWTKLDAKLPTDPWFTLFTDVQIRNTADAITNLLQPVPPALYRLPAEEDLLLLTRQLSKSVPPVGSYLDAQQKVQCRVIDFRVPIEAGWLTATGTSLPFSDLNHLCETGILQQKAVNMSLGK